jgi:hypothetical protein
MHYKIQFPQQPGTQNLCTCVVYILCNIGDSIRELYKRHDIIAELKIRRLRWVGHILRKKDDSIANSWNSTIEGKRLVGRPRSRWKDQVLKDVRRIKKDTSLANNRNEWRKLVDEAKNLLGFQESQRVSE